MTILGFSLGAFPARSLLWLLLCGIVCFTWQSAGSAVIAQPPPLATVSAASYDARALAPEAIAAAFGAGLAARVEAAAGLPLPTTLAGSSVVVRDGAGVERPAPLFFVSPGQINFQLPAGTAAGAGLVSVRLNNQIVAAGAVQISTLAPAIFTANGNGRGVPAALLLRVKSDHTQSFEPVAQYDEATRSFVTKPLDLGPEGERVFLILYLSGLRQAQNSDGNPGNGAAENVRIVLGGNEITPDFAGAVAGLAGLEQINLALPRALLGRGRLSLSVTAVGATASNVAEIDIGARPGSVQITSFNTAAALAGQALVITGQGFSARAAENRVRIRGASGQAEAQVVTATATELTVLVPFGAASGQVSVASPQGESTSAQPLAIRTSVSGFVQDNRRQPLNNVLLRIQDGARLIEARTNAQGAFILPEAPTGDLVLVEVDGTRVNAPPGYTRELRKVNVFANRDNQFAEHIELKPNIGPNLVIPAAASALVSAPAPASPLEFEPGQQTGNVTLTIPAGAVVTAADGTRLNNLTLTVVDAGRTPANLPEGHFSSTIAQIAPFGAAIAPGARLTFPNTDGFPAGARITLFRFDQTRSSSTVGTFVAEAEPALVSADGQRIETAVNAIKQTTYYFVSLPRQTVTVVGHVVENDRLTPVLRSISLARGQNGFTDGNGGYVLRGVPLTALSRLAGRSEDLGVFVADEQGLVTVQQERLAVEASFMRPTSRVDRAEPVTATAATTGLAAAPDLIMPGSTAAPLTILARTDPLSVAAGTVHNEPFLIISSQASQLLQVRVSGANFASVLPQSGDNYVLRIAPGNSDGGNYTLIIAATDSFGATASTTIVLRVTGASLTATGETVTTNQNTPIAITLKGSDPANRPLTFFIVRPPTRGSLSGTPPQVTYTPQAGFSGTDSFTFKVNNGQAESAEATVTILVRPVNQAPVINVPGALTINGGQNLAFTVTATDADAGQVLTFAQPANLPPGANFVAATGRFSWTPVFQQNGTYAVTFSVTDSGVPPLSAGRAVVITVDSKWARTSGPGGAIITSVFATETRLFAGTSRNFLVFDNTGNDGGELFISADQGRSWTAAAGLPNQEMLSLTGRGETVFVGTFSDGIYRSTDNGQNWQRTSAPTGRVVSLLMLEDAVYAGYENVASTSVYRSLDNGQTWQRFDEGMQSESIIRLAAVGATLFAGLSRSVPSGGGLYRLAPGATRWTRIEGFGFRNARSLAVRAGTLFIGVETGANTGQGSVFRTDDLGATLTELNAAARLASPVTGVAVSGDTLLAATVDGLFQTSLAGTGWTPSTRGLANSIVLSLFAASDAVLAGTAGGGVFTSTDAGANWSELNAGIVNTNVTVLARNQTALFAGSERGGLYRSLDLGQSWTSVLPNQVISAVAVNGNTIFAGTYADGPGNVNSIRGRGIFRSTDNGATWAAVNTGLPIAYFLGNQASYYHITALGIAGATIFAQTQTLGVGGVYVSRNNGDSWEPLPPVISLASISAYAMLGGAVFAATNDQFNRERGVFRSDDGGQSWAAASNGLREHDLNVKALLAVGDTLFAGTVRTVLRSTDQGANWAEAGTGLPGFARYLSLAASGAHIFAGTERLGVFRSSDGGRMWTPANNGVPRFSGTEFAGISAIAAVGAEVYLGTPVGILRSTDQGESWTRITIGPGNTSGFASTGATLLAAGSGVFRSTDNGLTWLPSSEGLPTRLDSAGRPVLEGIIALAASGGIVLAATPRGIYRSDDDGRSWRPVNNGLLRYSDGVTPIYSLGVSGTVWLAGTYNGGYRSTDGGANWETLKSGLPYFSSFANTGTALLAGTAGYEAFGRGAGLFRSTDQGRSWGPVYRGLDAFAFDVTALAASEADGAVTIYAGTLSTGVRRSTDDGRTWTEASGGLRSLQGSISSITALAASGAQVYAILGTRRVFVSANQGQSWEPVNNSLPSQLVTTSLTLSGNNVFAGTRGNGVYRLTNNTQSWAESNRGLASRSVNSVVLYGGALFAGTLGGGVFRSTDGGANWAAVNEGLPVGVNAFALVVSGQTLLAGTFGDGVFRYDEAANGWVAANAGLDNRFINALAVSDGAIFAGVGNGRDLGNVYRSLDQGRSWQAVGQSLSGFRVLALAVNGGALIAGTDGGGVFLATDQGLNWRPANAGLTSRDVRSLAVLGTALFAGTLRGGVFRSADGGANWTAVNRELPPGLPVFALATEGTELFAGTVYGVFRSGDQGETWRQVNAGLLDIAVTALTVNGATLYAGTKNGGVFLSQIR